MEVAIQKQSVRVILASEYPQVRHLLSQVIEQEGEVDVVGQAQDANKALTLTRNLIPDVAVIDCYLPYTAGLGATPLSRINGLDIAQAISKEIPSTRVILLRNLDEYVLPEHGLASDDVVFFSREITGANIPFTIHELYHQALPPGALVFADVEVEQRLAPQHKATKLSYKTVLFAALGTLGGLLIILAVTFGGGIFLALAGVAAMFLGLAGKLTASLWAKRKSRDKGDQ